MGTVVGCEFIAHCAQSHLAEHHQALGLVFGPTVICTFADDIRKVNTFAEHVACRWSLKRRYFKSFRKNAHIIGQSRAMPKHHFIGQLSPVFLDFFLSSHDKDTHNLNFVLIVGGRVGIFDVFVDPATVLSVF